MSQAYTIISYHTHFIYYVCDQYSNDHDLIYNSKKTMCMRFTPKSCKSYECKLTLNEESLWYVRESRYLWVVTQLSGTDKDVAHRQVRKYYAGINNSYKTILCMLIRCKMLLI